MRIESNKGLYYQLPLHNFSWTGAEVGLGRGGGIMMEENVHMITVQLGRVGFSNFYGLYVIERIQLHRN